MTKIEIINEIIVKKQELLEKLNVTKKKLEDSRVDAMFNVMQKYFGGEFTLDDVYISKPKSNHFFVIVIFLMRTFNYKASTVIMMKVYII